VRPAPDEQIQRFLEVAETHDLRPNLFVTGDPLHIVELCWMLLKYAQRKRKINAHQNTLQLLFSDYEDRPEKIKYCRVTLIDAPLQAESSRADHAYRLIVFRHDDASRRAALATDMADATEVLSLQDPDFRNRYEFVRIKRAPVEAAETAVSE
jgi:hypothetical protein